MYVVQRQPNYHIGTQCTRIQRDLYSKSPFCIHLFVEQVACVLLYVPVLWKECEIAPQQKPEC